MNFSPIGNVTPMVQPQSTSQQTTKATAFTPTESRELQQNFMWVLGLSLFGGLTLMVLLAVLDRVGIRKFPSDQSRGEVNWTNFIGGLIVSMILALAWRLWLWLTRERRANAQAEAAIENARRRALLAQGITAEEAARGRQFLQAQRSLYQLPTV